MGTREEFHPYWTAVNSDIIFGVGRFGDIPDHQQGVRCKANSPFALDMGGSVPYSPEKNKNRAAKRFGKRMPTHVLCKRFTKGLEDSHR